jgi:hypothetical protein
MPLLSNIMRPLFISVMLLFLVEQISFAQETFKIQNASREYDLVVQVEACGGEKQNNDPNNCSGLARISIYRKGAEFPFQVLNLRNVEVYKDTIAHNPKINTKPRGLYEEEYSFVFEDFNFDGNEDLAICNGRHGGYGGPSYNVYLFTKQSNKFIENKRLSGLTEGVYLGLFFVDSKKKRLVTFSKSGCCYHETEKYKLANNKPVLVEKIIEEASGSDDTGYDVMVTTRRLINGKWVKRVRKKLMGGSLKSKKSSKGSRLSKLRGITMACTRRPATLPLMGVESGRG